MRALWLSLALAAQLQTRWADGNIMAEIDRIAALIRGQLPNVKSGSLTLLGSMVWPTI